MEQILLPVVAIGGMGLIFGALLAVAAKIFAVEEDERIPKITDVLPGANCGGCGFAGCSAYAAAVVTDGAKVNLCPVGGAAVAQKIADIMGVEAEEAEKMVARVMCMGASDIAGNKYINNENIDCHTANRLSGGMKNCSFGCLGLGSCAEKCQFDAISITGGLAFIDKDKCTNCGACIKECPRGIIKSVPYSQEVAVVCSSKANGKVVRAVCGIGCIGCGICAKSCESGAITVDSFLAEIDPKKCTACGICVEKCPRKVIKMTEIATEPEIVVARRAKVG